MTPYRRHLVCTLGLMAVIAAIVCSCERDDICAVSTPTTPQLVISFLDVDAEEKRTSVNLFTPEDTSRILAFRNETQINIPLRTNSNETRFVIVKNPTDDDPDPSIEDANNADVLIFNYETREVFISRACGYRIVYDNVDALAAPGEDGRWIDDIIVEINQVVDQDTTHIQIFH